MLSSDAVSKVCPFMSNTIHESPIGPNMSGITVPGISYCMVDACMSWEWSSEHARDNLTDGYCKLMEVENGPIY